MKCNVCQKPVQFGVMGLVPSWPSSIKISPNDEPPLREVVYHYACFKTLK